MTMTLRMNCGPMKNSRPTVFRISIRRSKRTPRIEHEPCRDDESRTQGQQQPLRGHHQRRQRRAAAATAPVAQRHQEGDRDERETRRVAACSRRGPSAGRARPAAAPTASVSPPHPLRRIRHAVHEAIHEHQRQRDRDHSVRHAPGAAAPPVEAPVRKRLRPSPRTARRASSRIDEIGADQQPDAAPALRRIATACSSEHQAEARAQKSPRVTGVQSAAGSPTVTPKTRMRGEQAG